MARIRAVKPSIRTSRVVLTWPEEVRYFWVLLWGYLDDEGRGLDSAKMIAGDCYPLDERITAAVVERRLALIAASKVGDREPPLCRYEVDGTRYIHAVNWDDNQKVNRPRPSMHPHCPTHEAITDAFSDSHTDAALRSHVLEGGRGKGEEGRGRELRAVVTDPAAPPPWCKRHPNGTDDPCRACQRAREAHEAWEASYRARIAAAPECPIHGEGTVAGNCGACRSEVIARPEEQTA